MASQDLDEAYERNQAAFRRMKASLDEQYPPGRFLALANDDVVADAPNLEELLARLARHGVDPQRTLVFQAGVEYPAETIIFAGAAATHAP